VSRPFFFSRKKKHEKAKKTPSCEVKCFSEGKTAQAKHGWCQGVQDFKIVTGDNFSLWVNRFFYPVFFTLVITMSLRPPLTIFWTGLIPSFANKILRG